MRGFVQLSLLLSFFAASFAGLAPSASAEFGPESEDGWPINVDGVVLRPPVVGHSFADPLNKVGPVTVYPYYPLLTAEMQRLASDHPGLVRLTSAGQTTAGLDVWLLEIANFQDEGAAGFLPFSEREVLYIDGGTHSNEYSGVYFVTEVAQFLLEEYEANATAKWIVDNRHTWIVPMVNVDGSHLFGRLNLNTVNVNRNFPATWGAVDEDPLMNNPGPAAESEVETRIVTGLMDRLVPDYVTSIHCCGNLWLHPFGAEELGDPADLPMYTRICDEAFAEVRKDCGPIWSTIYPASGTTSDEGYLRVGAAGWGYEMSGRGAIAGPWGEPAVDADVRVQERESWAGVMHAFLNVEKYGASPVVVEAAGTVGRLVVMIENQGWGNLTEGTVTLGGVQAGLPFLNPGERAQVTLEGSFAAGSVPVVLEYRERLVATSPMEVRNATIILEGEGDALASQGAARPAVEAEAAAVPGVPIWVVVVLIGLAAVALRRRT